MTIQSDKLSVGKSFAAELDMQVMGENHGNETLMATLRNGNMQKIVLRTGSLAVLIATCLSLFVAKSIAQTTSVRSGRLVLVELFTSQGCDMCPTAERILGELGDSNRSVAAVAMHVDYFNRPWKDPFSDSLFSDRQMSYHNTYKGPKDPKLGLYYTPMVMVDGLTTVNGRDPARLRAAVAAARKKPPGVRIQGRVEGKPSAKGLIRLNVSLTPVSEKLKGRDQLLCAILRDDSVTTNVDSGENAGKTLTNRFPARKMQFQTLKLESKAASEISLEFSLDSDWDQSRLSFVVFLQDVATGEVHQTAVIALSSSASSK